MEFDPFSSDFFDDPYPTYRWLRDEAPVYHNERYGFWALSRYDDVIAAHKDWETFTSTHGLTLADLTNPDYQPHPTIIMMDPPAHDRLRRLVSRAFTPRSIADLEPLVRDVVRSYLDALDGRDAVDLVAEFSAPFPVEVISAVLGVPEGDRQQIRHWVDEMLHREPNDPNPTKAGIEAAIFQGAYFYDLIKEKRRRPGPDMISQLIEAEVTLDDGSTARLTDEEIAGFATLLGGAGSETVTKAIGSAVVELWRHPDQWQLVLDDPARIPDAIEEVLRYQPPSQYQGRFSTREAHFEGGTIPAHQPVFLITGAASRDPRGYDDPDRFDITRPAKLSVFFGHGIHLCLGAALARLECRVALEEVRARWPRYEVDESGLRRVQMTNVAGYSNVPVAVGASAGASA